MTAHLLSEIAKLQGHRVLCVGDVILDRFVYGAVSRISPEAPIPVLLKTHEIVSLGGAGNVARNITSLGGQIDLIGVAGADHDARELDDRMGGDTGIRSLMIADDTRPTSVKTRYVADGQQLLRADHEKAKPVSAEIEDKIIAAMDKVLPDCSVVILSDYAKGVLTDRVVREAIDRSHGAGKIVLIDPKGRDFSRYRGADILTPNRKELSEATDRTIASVADAEAAARQLIAQNDLGGVMAKLGADGVCLVMKDKPARHYQTLAREVFEVSGAGDTVVSTMALALAAGVSVEDSAVLANLGGSIVVGKVGTASVTREELSRELRRNQFDAGVEKVMNLAQAAAQAEQWRKQGLKVGFTNGVFDLLHPGHLSLIRQARAGCDRLIVGMNSDASVKRLKGESRPVQGEDARAMVLSALADVDGVVVFGEDTPIELIKGIKPDLLVKGADYTVATVVGSDLVLGWGGEVKLADLVDGQSTTRTIAKLRS